MNQYEAMFLFDPTFGSSLEKCEGEIRRLMERAQAQILFCGKWDERRLAYKIRGRKRGVYVLVYFKAAPDKIASLKRDVKLSESILRILVLRADDVTREAMEQAFPTGSEKPAKTGDKSDEVSAPAAAADGTAAAGDAASAGKVEPVAKETAVADPPGDESATKAQ